MEEKRGIKVINTHGLKLTFGKYKGELLTRIPVSYLKFMINNNTQMSEEAKCEFERRGDTLPEVELSGHAIDNASLRVRKIWHEDRVDDEGLYSWLQRITIEAIKDGVKLDGDKIKWKGMKLVIIKGEEFPVLKTIMR